MGDVRLRQLRLHDGRHHGRVRRVLRRWGRRQRALGHVRVDCGAEHLLRDRHGHDAQPGRAGRPACRQEAPAGAFHLGLRGLHAALSFQPLRAPSPWRCCWSILSNTFYSYGESLTASFLPELARPEGHGQGQWLGMGVRLLRRHAGAGNLPGLRALGAAARHSGRAVRAGHDAAHRRAVRGRFPGHLRLLRERAQPDPEALRTEARLRCSNWVSTFRQARASATSCG
jgi:hypothetical protein